MNTSMELCLFRAVYVVRSVGPAAPRGQLDDILSSQSNIARIALRGVRAVHGSDEAM